MKNSLALTLMAFPLLAIDAVTSAIIFNKEVKVNPSLQFRFQTENGQQRSEAIHYNTNVVDNDVSQQDGPNKSLEFRGDYSFISADGYRYTVTYRANKRGYLPYVTVQKVI